MAAPSGHPQARSGELRRSALRRGVWFLETLWQDAVFSVRTLWRQKLLSLVVALTLTLSIGISTAVFTLYDADALRARVDKDFDSFAQVYSGYSRDPARAGYPGETTLEDYLAYGQRVKSIGRFSAYTSFRAPMGDDPTSVHGLFVTANFFSLYDVEQPLLGRLIQPEDFTTANPVVVLSESLWRDRFSADPHIVGKEVHFNSRPVTVVGIVRRFAGQVGGARAWFPYTLASYLKHGDASQSDAGSLWAVAGRLNPGFSHRDAQAELRLLASQQDGLHPGRHTSVVVTDGSAFSHPAGTNRKDHERLFLLVLASLTFVVLIVCVNVTTLLLSRATARRQEIAVRHALGAGRLRLIRMLLTETFLLTALAAVASVYLAHEIPVLLDHWLGSGLSDERGLTLAPDWRVFAYLGLTTVLAGILAGLTPALQSLRVDLSEMLKGRQSTPGGRGSRLYGFLIGAQVALSFLLLYGAVLFLDTAWRAASFAPGFETQHVLWTGLSLQGRGTGQRTWGAFHQKLADRIAALPGVRSVAYSNRFPLRGSARMEVERPSHGPYAVDLTSASPNYFTTLGIPFIRGHSFREGDPLCGRTLCSVVVSQRLAREFWPGENPLGKVIRDTAGNRYEIVGVAGDVSNTSLGRFDEPTIYQPLDSNGAEPASAFVRFSGDEAGLSRAVFTAVRELAPSLSVEARTIQSVRNEETARLWRYTQLIVLLCGMAVLLAVLGIYGVVAFAVSRRSRELGIRIAFGAQSKDIYRAVLGSSGRPVAIGLLIGLALTVGTFLALGRLARGAWFTVDVVNPLSYALTAILLSFVGLVAMLIPARRATKIDPMAALRYE